MFVADPQLNASQVLRVFHHDEVFLFFGAAFTTVGLVAAILAFLTRKFEATLFWLGLFAILYGNRLWLQSDLLVLMVPPSLFFDSLRSSADYIVSIPAFFYFESMGLMGRHARKFVYLLSAIFLGLFAATFIFGPLRPFHLINNVIIIVAVLALIVRSLQRGRADRAFVILRRGLLVFAAFVLFDNVAGTLGHRARVEPYGFAFFLACLGYVTARRTLQRDQMFGEIQKELDVARRIQLSILPEAFPPSTCFRVAARYTPMTAVAGDFYDFLIGDNARAGLLIADVSGHGVPAALIASMVKLAAASQRANAHDPAALLREMNQALCGNTQSQFVTAAYAYLDAPAGELRYAAAAHPPMLLLRGGEVREIVENGLMLAAFSFAAYETSVQPLEPGDRLVLYTDGLLEAADAKQEQFGQQRLCALVRASAHQPHGEAADTIMAAVQRWAAAQEDDMTLLVCDYHCDGAAAVQPPHRSLALGDHLRDGSGVEDGPALFRGDGNQGGRGIDGEGTPGEGQHRGVVDGVAEDAVWRGQSDPAQGHSFALAGGNVEKFRGSNAIGDADARGQNAIGRDAEGAHALLDHPAIAGADGPNDATAAAQLVHQREHLGKDA